LAKKHPNRPALKGIDVARWVSKGILQVVPVRRTAVLYTKKGKSVRQRWLRILRRKRNHEIITQTAITYLRKGAFLIPIWLEVPNWEVLYLVEQHIDFKSQGIQKFGSRWMRISYMQVEDLDHAMRQQIHVLDQYLDKPQPTMSDFYELFEKLARSEKITKKVTMRKLGVDSLFSSVTIRLRQIRMSLESILANAPLFRQTTDERQRQPVTSSLTKYAQECRKLTLRPVGVRLNRAARSLERAVEHIKNERFLLAKQRIQSALKNLIYPEPEIANES
jgi:hypothetical protein